MNALILKVTSDILSGWLLKSQIVDVKSSKNCFYLIFNKAHRVHTAAFSMHPQAIFIQKTIPRFTEKDNFYQYAKKHLIGLSIINIKTALPDRVLMIDMEKSVGIRKLRYKLIVEFMGRNPNIIVADDSNIVQYAINITPKGTESARPIRVGKKWPPPIKQYKTPIWEIEAPEELTIEKIMKSYCGIDKKTAAMIIENGSEKLLEIKKQFLSKNFVPKVVYYENRTILFPFKAKLIQKSKTFNDFVSLFDYLYIQGENQRRIAHKKENFNRLIKKELLRLNNKLKYASGEIKKAAEWKKYEDYAVFIKSNLWKLNGHKRVSSLNLSDPYCDTIKISPKLTVIENMSRLFNQSKKLKRTLTIKKKIIEKIENDIKTLNQIEYDLKRSNNEEELFATEEELFQIGLIKEKKAPKRIKTAPNSNIIKKQLNNITIYIGKNAKGNEKITFELAGKNDLWLHAKDVPGSHILLKGNYSEKELKYAAYLAAINSKAYKNGKIDVDYVSKKFIKKPKGAKLGMVIYKNYKTITVKTDEIWNY